MSKRTYATQEWHTFAARVQQVFIASARVPNPAKLYKLAVHEAPQDPVLRMVAWAKRTNLHCLAVQNHNMSRTNIESQPTPHALHMLINLTDGTLQRFLIAPATATDIERFSRAWPNYIHETASN